jgi:serine/threonine protein kinase
MGIAAGVASGLRYLHEHGVVYRGMTCSNILLGDGYHPKLSEHGMAGLRGPQDDLETGWRPTGKTMGYLAPEIAETGQLSVESDVYSFGVVLLAMITGRRAFDGSPACASGERNLAAWVTDRWYSFANNVMLLFQ